MFQNKNFKSFQLFIVIVFGILMILGSGEDNKTSSNSANPPATDNTDNTPPIVKKTTTGVIELGKIEGGAVTIEALDGYVLMTLSDTGKSGEITIDIEELKSKVSDYDSSIKLVKIISTGGVDTDPNDDGIIIESEKKEVYSSIEAILPLTLLYSTDGYHVNFMTSFVADILKDISTEDIDKEYLDFLVNELGMYDVNQDGKITVEDIIYYDMVNNDSDLEAELRTTYLETFHTNSSSETNVQEDIVQEDIVNDYKKYIGLSKVKVDFSNNQFSVKIIKSNKNNKILYGVSSTINELELEEYSNIEFTVENDDVLMFIECISDDECYHEQKVYFLDNKFYYNNAPEKIPESNFLSLVESIQNRDKKIKELEEEIKELEEN